MHVILSNDCICNVSHVRDAHPRKTAGMVKCFQILGTSYIPTDQFNHQRIYFNAPLSTKDYFGSAIAALDIDRDGCVDLLVGARGFNQRYQDEGAVFACYMDRSGMNLVGWEQAASQIGLLVPCQPGEQFGAAIAAYQDCSGNPLLPSLLFVGAPGETLGTCQGGSVYVMRVQPL